MDFAGFEEAQQLRLDIERAFADFVEEQRAAVGGADDTGKCSIAPVNAPRRWPKSCESSMSRGVAVQLKGRNVFAARGE
jgi:hypothetical protein